MQVLIAKLNQQFLTSLGQEDPLRWFKLADLEWHWFSPHLPLFRLSFCKGGGEGTLDELTPGAEELCLVMVYKSV